MTPVVAGIDCGTNSVRLLVAAPVADDSGAPTRLVDLDRRMQIVRLGQGVDRTGRLDPAALERTFAALRDYADVMHDLGSRRRAWWRRARRAMRRTRQTSSPASATSWASSRR